MAQIFRDLSYARPLEAYKPMNVEAIDELGKSLNERYKANKEGLSKARAALKGFNVRKPYQPLVDEKLSETRGKLSALAARGDYENIGNDLMTISTEFDEDDTVRAALVDKQEYDKYKKEQTKRVGAKTNSIRQSQYDRALEYSEFQNAEVKYDPATGKPITVFKGYNPVENQDISGAMMDMVKDWKESKTPLKYKDSKGKEHEIISTPGGYLRTSDKTYVDEAEVAGALRQVIANNPAYSEFIQEEVMFKIQGLTGGGDFTLDHLKAAGIDEAELRKYLEKKGIDVAKAMSNPAFLEGVTERMLTDQIAESYIDPAAKKAGFESIESKFMTDNVLMESISAANRLNHEKYKQDREAQREQDKFDRSIILTNESVVLPDSKVDVMELKKQEKEKSERLEQINRALALHSSGDPNAKGDYSVLKQEKAQLEAEIAVSKGTFAGKAALFDESADYNLFLDNSYKEYENSYKKLEKHGTPEVKKLSRAEFASKLREDVETQHSPTINWDNVKSGNWLTFGKEATTTLWNNMISGNRLQVSDKKQAEFDVNNQVAKAAYNYKKKINHYVAPDNTETKGTKFNIIDEPDLGNKSGSIRQFNKMHSEHMRSQGAEYTAMASGEPFNKILMGLAAKSGEDPKDIVIESLITDGDLDGKFPFTTKVTSKKTGEVLFEGYVMPGNGGREERVTIGHEMVNKSKPGSDNYNRGLYMIASGTYPELSKTKLAPQLAAVNSNSSTNTAPAVTAPINIGDKTFRIIKRRHTFKDGDEIGTETVYEAVAEDPKNPVVDKNGDFVRANVIDYLPNPQAKSKKPEEQILFKSLDDIQTTFFLKNQ